MPDGGEASAREETLVERIWFGGGAGAAAARLALAPLEVAYRAVVAARGALYDAGVLRAVEPAIPAVSVGNLSVGGTGKTPVASWLAGELVARGARPAIVLRGYGDDEPLVHRRLRPGVPVIASPDRVAGIARAAEQGADVVVLDDAFQHRRVRRAADIVLVSADAWGPRRRLLPAGPWREPLASLRRASLAIVTRKAAAADRAALVARSLAQAAPSLPIAIARLEIGALRRADGDDALPLDVLAGRDVLAIAAIGDPGAFVRQLQARGAKVRPAVFPDHHRFDAAEASRLAGALRGDGFAVCTLKDAVKLAPLWPRAGAALWYVSQHVAIERGREELDALLGSLLSLRRDPT
jgi:tetraacyldisaccharide 4'-kinase